jgi:hypothetical protein
MRIFDSKNRRKTEENLWSSKTPDLTRMSEQSQGISHAIVNAMGQPEFVFGEVIVPVCQS